MKLSKRIDGVVAILLALGTLPARSVAQQPSTEHGETSTDRRYNIVDLGPVGPPPGQPFMISNNGLVAGSLAAQDGTEHATLWFGYMKLDLGATLLPGLNSMSFGVNEGGQAVGAVQTSDPNSEDFCGFNAYGFPASNTTCLPFVWNHGVVHHLPTLGGSNGYANMINDEGEVVGLAENSAQDANCPVHQFRPVVWRHGKPYPLPTPGDLYGIAAYINQKGQVVGASGTCTPFNSNTQLYLSENHALMWENDGTPHNLPSLGGAGGIAGNHPCGINNRGQAVGHSELPNNTTFHAVLWPDVNTIRDLGTLSGDYASLALGINDSGNVVGASLDANFNPRAYIWENNSITDLNTRVSGHSSLYLLLAESINNGGEIVGFGATNSGDVHGFIAVPCDRDDDRNADIDGATAMRRPVLSDAARELLRQHLLRRQHINLPQ